MSANCDANRFGRPVGRRASVFSLICLLCLAATLLSTGAEAQPQPSWVSTSPVRSSDGFATLRWGIDGSEPVALFRITEYRGPSRQVSYTDQAELRIYRIDPGTYFFRVEACVRDSAGYPRCGKASSRLTVEIGEELDHKASPKPEDAPRTSETALGQGAPAGGPGVLRPGLWSNPDRPGHGWSFFWSNRLALPESHALHGNEYDLVGFWYTYEARARYLDGPPPCGEGGRRRGCYWAYADYRPLFARLELVRVGPATYEGAVVIERADGTAQHGTATVTFGAENTRAEVSWTAQFRWQALAGTDPIRLLAGGDGSASDSVSHYSGLWSHTGTSTPNVATNLGAISEATQVTFFDGGGDPGWMQAETSAPGPGETDLCFYYVWSGFAPDSDGTIQFHSSGCDPGQAAGGGNRNGKRAFTGFESARIWLDYQLPDGGHVALGSSANPLALTRRAGFHRIWFTGENACQIGTASPTCPVNLTWFTDGDYPDASAFAFNQSTGQRVLIARSNAPAVENHVFDLTRAGTWRFELRMRDSAASTLIARSSAYTVAEVQGPPASPAQLAVSWTDQANRRYRVEWQHSDPAGVSHYVLTETQPGGGSVAYTVSPGTNLSRSFDRSSGPYGNYGYRVRACRSSHDCSADSAVVGWAVSVPETPPPGEVQFPWRDNQFGSLRTGQSWNYALGYHFRPEVDGRITHLGGFYSGVKQVKLFRRATGALLAQATVSSSNGWNHVPVTAVAVTAGEEYTVAAYLAGSGASYRSGLNLPRTFGDITILGGTAASTSSNAAAIPVSSASSVIYGQPDIGFEPDATSVRLPPSIEDIPDQQHLEGDAIALQVLASDADGSVVSLDDAGSLPPGLSVTAGGLISGTIASGAADGSPYDVTITATDDDGLTADATFSWTVSRPAKPGNANPETPPPPADVPPMTPSASSSRVGATAGTFRVDESGNANYRIPILTAPGSGGMAPELALEYSSQGGNGPLGIGWSVGGVSSITRCKQSLAVDGAGAVRGVTLTPADRFCLDGQRLVAVVGEYGAAGTEYRTEIDGIAKIVSHGVAGTGPHHFTIARKDGTVIELGASTDSRIEARTSSDKATVLVWAQNRITDTVGNFVDYIYDEISHAGTGGIEFVLARVAYTGNVRAATLPYAEIVFTYDGARPDATVSFVGGARVEQSRLLTRIDSRARVDAGSALQWLRSYLLTYADDQHDRRILASLTECRDSSGAYCFPSTSFDWQSGRHFVSSSSVEAGSVFHDDHVGTAIGDVTGDGRPDLLLTRRYGGQFRLEIAPALDNGGFGPRGQGFTLPAGGTDDRPVNVHAIDLDADGFQDVVYPSGGNWKARLSNGSGLGAEIDVGGGCCGLSDPQLVRIIDFDGDGLSDLVTHRPRPEGGTEIVWLRNVFSSGLTPTTAFAPPQRLEIAVDASLFPEQSPGDGWYIDTEPPRFVDRGARGASFSRPFDYDGDGAVDLLVELSQRYVGCDNGHCGSGTESSAASTRILSNFVISDGDSLAEAPAGFIHAWASFYVVLLSDGSNGFVQADIVGRGADCTVDAACDAFAHLPSVRRALPVDVNADGLADFAYQDGFYDWRVRHNTGAGFVDDSILVAELDSAGQSIYAGFVDMTGDGLPDFVYPDEIGSPGATWQVHENRFGTDFSPPQGTMVRFGDSKESDQSLLVDFTGDGIVDNLFIELDALGAVDTENTRLYRGTLTGSGVGPGGAAAAVISKITNGFGASTEVVYRPLTDGDVYSRMRDGKAADWGGLAVYDIVAPIHVVSQVDSSSATVTNADAVNRVEYHYVGAKVQAGGRGFLGFGEIIAYEPQSGIRVNTRFRQDFPYIGLVADSTRTLASVAAKFGSVSDVTKTRPVDWTRVSAATGVPALPSGTLLRYSVNEWQTKEPVWTNGPQLPFIAASLTREYTASGTFSHKVLTTNTYENPYGNLDREVVQTFESETAGPFATQTTVNTWQNDLSHWRLGRLSASAVTYDRGVLSDRTTRSTTFGYDGATGLLTQEIVEPGDPELGVLTTYVLDDFGNRTVTTVTGAGMAARSQSHRYDALGRYVEESRNALGQTTLRVTQRDIFGNALRSENIDGVLTINAADHMGRPFMTASETGAWTKTLMVAGAGGICPASGTAWHTVQTGGGQPARSVCFDRLGREGRAAVRGFAGTWIYVDTRYDVLGRVVRISEPYFANGNLSWNVTSFDAIGRTSRVKSADGNDIIYEYDEAAGHCLHPGGPRRTRITNALGQGRLEIRNALGEVTGIVDNACAIVNHAYDAAGNLVRLAGPDGAESVMTFDRAGRKVSLDDPDKGTWRYAWNALGEITRKLDARGQAVDYEYDRLGRVTARYERTGVSSLGGDSYVTVNSERTQWNDATTAGVTGRGQARELVYREGTSGAILHRQTFSYDAFGRQWLRATQLDGLELVEESTYDQFGRPFQQFDVSGDARGVRYHYNGYGYVEALQEAREGEAGIFYQRTLDQDARGNVTYMRFGNGVEAFAEYQPQSGRLLELDAYGADQVEIQRISYVYDSVGNLLSRHDTSGSLDRREEFDYDSMNRLERVMLSSGGFSQETLLIAYDDAGNITHKSDVGDYQYGSGGNGPHAVTLAGQISYDYDANGNQIWASNGRTITYSVFDKAARIQKGSELTEFRYGIGNQRIERLDSNDTDGDKRTWYFGNVERIRYGDDEAFFRRHIDGVAIVNYFPETAESASYYVLKDHLGSTHSLVDESGTAAGAVAMHFDAFGSRRNADWVTPLSAAARSVLTVYTTRGFTGHEHADGLGIVHMNGRIYDPRLGRFLQADPFVQDPTSSQSLNRYSYVLNNPLSYTDPTGYFSLKRFFKRWGRVIVAAVTAYFTYGWASEIAWSMMPSTLAGVATPAAYTASGAIGGASAGFVGGAIAARSLEGAVKGAFSGTLFGGIAGYFDPTYSAGRVVLETAAGGISSLAHGGSLQDGLLTGAIFSSATLANVRLRNSQKLKSEQFPGQVGQSRGFRGISGKLAGERINEDLWTESGAAAALESGLPLETALAIYEKARLEFGSLSPLGCLQGGPGCVFKYKYKRNGFVDYVLEGYAGVHDSLNEPFFYKSNGTNRTLSSWEEYVGKVLNPSNVLIATPVVAPSLVPDYMRFLLYQDPNS